MINYNPSQPKASVENDKIFYRNDELSARAIKELQHKVFGLQSSSSGTFVMPSIILSVDRIVVTNSTTGELTVGPIWDPSAGRITTTNLTVTSAISAATANFSGAISASNLSGTNTGDQTITLTGDVTGSGTGSFAATISSNSVTLAKFQQITTSSFLGRNTAGAGNVEVLSISTVLTMLGISTSSSPIFTGLTISGLTASQAVFTNASKALVSNPITGSGNVVMSVSPTLTGTISAADLSLSGALAVIGVSRFGTGTITFASKNLTVIGSSFDSTCVQFENTDVNTVANGRAFNFGVTDVSSTNGRFDLTQPGERTVLSVFSNGNVGFGSTTDGGEKLQITGTFRVTGSSTLAALSATTGAFSSTLAVTGIQTNSEALVFTGSGTGGAGRIFNSATNGLTMRANTGSAYDWYVFSAANNSLIRNPTGGSTLEFPGTAVSVGGTFTLSSLSSGRIPVVSTAGLITQDNLYWDATNDRLGIGSGSSSPDAEVSVTKSAAGSTVDIKAENSNTSAGSSARIYAQVPSTSTGDPYFLSNVSGGSAWSFGADNSDADAFVITPASTLGGATNGLRISTAGAVTIPGTLGVTGVTTFTVAPVLSAATAERVAFANGSKSLVTGSLYWDETNVKLGIGYSPIYDLTIAKSTVGSVKALILNQDTGSDSHATLSIETQSGSAGDSYISFSNGVNTYSIGLDNSASDAFVIARSGALGTSNALSISTTGNATFSGNVTCNFVSATDITHTGSLSSNGEVRRSASLSQGAGGSDFTNEVAITITGINNLEITPTATNQTYKLDGATDGQTLFITNISASYALVIDLETGAGTNTQYIIAGKSVFMRYNGTRWYSTY